MGRVDLDNNVNQSEYPKLTYKNGTYYVQGYQSFEIDKKKICNPRRKLLKKCFVVKSVIDNNQKNCKTLLDIGCSQGYYSYYANFKNYLVTSIEHDPNYVNQMKTINKKLDFNIDIQNKKFSQIEESKYDIVLFLAIIHWVYNSTEKYNSFHKILDKLLKITNKILIIEWISEKDDAIISTDKSKNVDYKTDRFISELKKKFKKIETKESNNKTRTLFICYK